MRPNGILTFSMNFVFQMFILKQAEIYTKYSMYRPI